jgi:hypothetical protein
MDDISKEDALQAAMLAKFVSSSLNQIDKFSVGGSTNQANRINMQQFIDPVLNRAGNSPQTSIQNSKYYTPPSEDVIKQMVPEVNIPIPHASPISESFQSNPKIEEYLKSIDENLKTLVSFIKNG